MEIYILTAECSATNANRITLVLFGALVIGAILAGFGRLKPNDNMFAMDNSAIAVLFNI